MEGEKDKWYWVRIRTLYAAGPRTDDTSVAMSTPNVGFSDPMMTGPTLSYSGINENTLSSRFFENVHFVLLIATFIFVLFSLHF